MSKFNEMIDTMRTLGYAEKKQFLQYLAQVSERAKHQFSQGDKEVLLAYAYEEMERMLSDIPTVSTYKEKDVIFECEDYLLGIVMHLSNSPSNLTRDMTMKIKALAELVRKERYIENLLDDIFEKDTISETDVKQLLYWVRQTTDEYQKSKLFVGLAHYQQNLDKISDGAKQLLTEYIITELQRLIPLDNEDARNTLELLADISKYFADEKVIGLLLELLKMGNNAISYYAVETLCGKGVDVPKTVIEALARDLVYANLTYSVLQRYGKTAMFPIECATEEYLAKSDMVRWLTYPTELGKVPDEIVYIGKIKQLFKKEVFHVFRFRSDSDTLEDALKNKWLVGWSSNEGGTFSNFDEFSPYEHETTEKALKQIKKRIIG